MAIWETEDESGGPAAQPRPTPNETPYRTTSRNSSRSRRSRKSRRSVTPPAPRSSPPLMPSTNEKGSKRLSRDLVQDESISILDPRRFTPTLHANLVSEILTLRRDQEEKLKIIESLEVSLHTSREEEEGLQTALSSTAKENRSLKRQLALLEGGTSSALGELARERDEAVETAAESKKRLETTQKKLRILEEDSERVHDNFGKEKDAWEEERRKYERKIHVAESRLKMVLDEVAAYQAAHMNGSQNGNGPEHGAEEAGRDNDAASIRTMSMTNSVRFSLVNTQGKTNGHSLADELNLDADSDYQTDHDGRESVLSNNMHARTTSRDSVNVRSHRRHLSNESLIRPGSVARGRLLAQQAALERLEDGIIQEDDESEPVGSPQTSYTDTGVQYSPLPSPKTTPSKPSTPETPVVMTARAERIQEVESPPRDWEIEANQRRKRVQLSRPLVIETPRSKSLMVSASSQTMGEPLSPPTTPKSPFQEQPPGPAPVEAPAMITSSTQTDPPEPPPLQARFFMPPPPIPSISIHPPTSRPTTPREPRLPPLSKDFGCQVSLTASPNPVRSAAMQTEEIRIDTRLAKLPPHLQPSSITSRPSSPAPGEADYNNSNQFTPAPGNLPPRNPRRLAKKQSLSDVPSSPPSGPAETHDAYPGNNDNGPLSGQGAPMRRPHRISSLFAGFDGGSSDEVDEFGDGEASDNEFRTALSAPKPKAGAAPRAGQRSSGGTLPTSPEQPPVPRQGAGMKSSARPLATEAYGSFALPERRDSRDSTVGARPIKPVSRTLEKAPPIITAVNSKPGVMRKAAMIQSGIATHAGRARSPSLPDPRDPPFPIPTRASSRKPPVSASAPSDGQRSPTRFDGYHSRHSSRSHYRANSIRKVRSAAALPRNQRYRRHGSRSPPPFSPSTEEPESPGLPPLPNNDITTPNNHRAVAGRYHSHRHQPSSTNTAITDGTGFQSTVSSAQPTGVVDAIAQTMVGEWMYKYVRRRKSFGVADVAGKEEQSNDRHKRWVWLAPYERAILWSSKQPSSGSALMGKPGRKLTIQSVLDVKDDNPCPKGAPQLFNRSILILTPQRALKFTATTAERHYVWLTSLSFLAHSQQAIPEIIVAPVAVKQPAPDFEMPPQPKRKNGIRDSIRLAKGRASAVARTAPASAAPSSHASEPPNIPNFRPMPGSFAMPALPQMVPPMPTHQRDLSRDTAAEPPYVPRFHDRANQALVHGRKRSNTGGHVPPPLSFRGFSGPAGPPSSSYHASTNSTAEASIGTAGSSDMYQSQASSNAMTWAMSTTASQRTSEASSRPGGAVMHNFFDAIGTVRMEAFISPLAHPRFFDEAGPPSGGGPLGSFPDEHDEMRNLARRRSKELRRRASRSRHRDSYNSYGTRGTRGTDDFYAGSRAGTEEDYFRDDPFKGF